MINTINVKSWGLSLMIIFLGTISFSQIAVNLESKENYLDQAEDYFDQGLYGQSRKAIKSYFDLTPVIYRYDKTRINNIIALSFFHRSGLRLKLSDAVDDMRNFLDENKAHPDLTSSLFEMADYMYNHKKYAEAIRYFDRINLNTLSNIELSEYSFKKGYCHFVKKEFDKSLFDFSYGRDLRNKYFYPINYYHGMAKYYNGDYSDAILSFRRVETSAIYKDHIPYYISQIYFAEKEYDKLINFGEQSILRPTVKKKSKIRLLLGQTYFQKNDYIKALPHLEFYEKNNNELTIEEFYQLAFTQYQLNQYGKAKNNFLELSGLDSQLGQLVNYYLADCYEKTGDKISSRAAFKKVSEMSYQKSMQEEATFNYGKLSSELGYEREAINILIEIEFSSPYYQETQTIINDILRNTSDYENSIAILESLPSLSNDLEATYQNVTFNRALQYYNESQFSQTIALFEKSQTYPYDPKINAQIFFWKAKMYADQGRIEDSKLEFQEYFFIANSGILLPEESSLPIAYYYQGYNNIKLKDYKEASRGFENTIKSINSSSIKNRKIKDRILPDAYLRAGDSYFKMRQYSSAKKYYGDFIDKRYPGYVYPLYQRSVIEGLEGKTATQIFTLQEIRDNHSNSTYADDALLQLGDTYFATGENEAAKLNLSKLVRDYKGKSNLINAAQLKLGLIYFNEGRSEEALAYYKTVFQNNPSPNERTEALNALEEIYIDELGRPDEYITYIDSMPGLKVTDFTRDSLTYKTADIQFRNGNYDRAVTAYSDYLRKYPNGYYKIVATYERAESYSSLRNFDEATKDYVRVINKGVSDYYDKSLKKAALISYNQGKDFEIALDLNQRLERSTTDPNDKFIAQLNSLKSAFRIEKDDDVIAYGNKVINNELVTDAEKSAALYYLAKVAYKKKEYDQSYSFFDMITKLSNNNQSAEALYMLAKIRYDQENLSDASLLASAANERNGAYPFWIAKSLILTSDIYVDRTDLLNGRAAIEAVIENFNSDETLLAEARKRLENIELLEAQNSRIKTNNNDGIIELDTIGQD